MAEFFTQLVVGPGQPVSDVTSYDSPTVSANVTSTTGMLTQYFSQIPFSGFGDDEEDPIIVNRDRAVGVDAIYAAIQIYCQFIEMMSCFLWEALPEGNNCRKAYNHRAYILSSKTIDREQPEVVLAGQFRAAIMYHALTNHGGYAEVVRDGRNDPKRLVLLDPNRMFFGQINGQFMYIYLKRRPGTAGTTVQYDPIPMKAKNVFHVRGFSDDCLTGKNAIRACPDDIGMVMAMHRHVRRYYVSGGGTKGFFLVPPGMSAETYANTFAVITEQIRQMNRSSGMKAGPLFDGIKYEAMTGSAEDAQLADIMKLPPKTVARLFNLPLHLLADDTKTTHNTLGDEIERLLRFSLNPWLVRFEGQYDSKLLTDRDWLEEKYYHKFDRRGTFQGSPKEVYEQARANLNGAIYGWKETRQQLGECTDPDDWFFLPANLIGGVIWNPSRDEFRTVSEGSFDNDGDGVDGAGSAADTPEKPAKRPPTTTDNGALQNRLMSPLRNLCKQTTERMSQRLMNSATAAIAKSEKTPDWKTYLATWLDEGLDKDRAVIAREMNLVEDALVAADLIQESFGEFNLVEQLRLTINPLLQSDLSQQHCLTLAKASVAKFSEKMQGEILHKVFGEKNGDQQEP